MTKPYVVYVKESDKVYYMGDNIIEIDDLVAKEVVLANFDLDGDGELSKQEALQVTDGSFIKSLFGDSSTIKAQFTNLSFLKYFKNAKMPNDVFAYFRGVTNCTSFDLSGLDFSSTTSLEKLFNGCTSATDIKMKGCDFRSVTAWGGLLDITDASLDIVVDFSESLFPASSSISTAPVRFTYYVKTITFIMNGCTSDAVELIKFFIHSSSRVSTMQIIVDGKKWTCAEKDGTWVESDV